MRMMGRPTIYSNDLADAICAELSAGKSLKQICGEDRYPSEYAVYSWLAKYPDFQKKYSCAREHWANAEFENILAIADDSTNDTVLGEDGEERPNHEWITRSRLRVDTRKWALARMNPRKYGEKQFTDIQVNVSLAGALDAAIATRDKAPAIAAPDVIEAEIVPADTRQRIRDSLL